MWTSFAADLDSNAHGGSSTRLILSVADDIVPAIPKWEMYTCRQGARNLVFRLPRNESYLEPDKYRKEGMGHANKIARQFDSQAAKSNARDKEVYLSQLGTITGSEYSRKCRFILGPAWRILSPNMLLTPCANPVFDNQHTTWMTGLTVSGLQDQPDSTWLGID